MPQERDILAILSGDAKGAAPAVARAGLSIAEPFYAAAMRTRNALFDRGFKTAHALGRPTVSVGNLTTGGTGKTPVVAWLARRCLDAGRRPAVLLRGYRADEGISDEAELYRQVDGLEVEANPDRVAGAAAVLARSPAVDVFLLDDAFQHRRAARDLDLVLIDATNPFGHGHVLPRGLLREPAAGLRRAGAVLVTHAEACAAPLLARLRQLNPVAPVYQCRHVLSGFDDAQGCPIDPARLARGGPVAALAGIGNPDAFFSQLTRQFALPLARRLALPDHATYGAVELARVAEQLDGMAWVVTTEKDWVKLRRQPPLEPAVARARLTLDFADGDADALWRQVAGAIQRPK